MKPEPMNEEEREPMIGEEAVARTAARRRVLFNMAVERREEDAEFVERAVEHAWRDFIDDARAAISAYREALERAGWVVVPREPTDAMLACAIPFPEHLRAQRDDGWEAAMAAATTAERMALRGRWQDMISAAPAQNSDEVKG